VFVIGVDAEGTYYSNVKAKVLHVGLSAKSFTISSVDVPGASPLVGGLVVATSDAAVLGQYVAHHTSHALGEGGLCVAFPVVGKAGSPRLDTPEAVVSRVFPMLNPGAWPDGMLEEVFTHSSCQEYSGGRQFNAGMLPLAYVGDSAMRLEAGVALREMGVPHARWQVIFQLDMTNAALAAKSEELGLHHHIKLGKGVKLQLGSKPHADVLEALCGAVYLCETTEVFGRFCRGIGLVREGYESL